MSSITVREQKGSIRENEGEKDQKKGKLGRT